MVIADISRFHAQKWLREESKKLNPPIRSLNVAYGIIRNAVNKSVRQGMLQDSYVDIASLLKGPKTATQIILLQEQESFKSAIKGYRLEIAYYVTLPTEMREGEVAALR